MRNSPIEVVERASTGAQERIASALP